MATFKVIVSKRDRWSVLVEAENEEQAKDIAQDGFDKDELDYEELQAQDGLFMMKYMRRKYDNR